MNVSVRHNGTPITSYVLEYEREHKICTGIGQLNLVVAGNIPISFEPWDEISIYENGSFQVKYYVSTITASKPSSTITLECQDKSKRLVDYFIPNQYTIDYPSYTGYWIKKFLTEAGISYQFMMSDVGVILSNNTTMGLTPAYEQIMQLLQLSGWYMYFDGNGIAKIGRLTTDLSSASGTYTKEDIITISEISDDKMLRNRAVVWGAFDPIRREFAYADVSTRTRWNYDSRDIRSMVVSNGNIPNKSSAYGIANKLIREFAKITVEKHLTVAGASNKNLGDVVRVRSDVFNGSGLITTFGVHMSKDGLITNLILDERCPRLFGFFDFGDYVYVGTYGAGVWRKHIKYDPTWYDFSTGLTNLAVTDLHINNDVFTSITASGERWYATSSEGPWVAHGITALLSSQEESVELVNGQLPSGIIMVEFSGIMGRATIIDRLTNIIRYGVDTYSGLNYGDYFIEYSGMMTSSGISASGIVASGVSASGYRGWIVEFDPFTAASGVYPISISGNFNMRVIDIENDGINDYVSVKTSSTAIPHTALGYNMGSKTAGNYLELGGGANYAHASQDSETKVSFNTLSFFNDDGRALYNNLASNGSLPSIFNNESIDEREIVYINKSTSRIVRTKVTKTWNIVDNNWDLGTATVTSTVSPTGTGEVLRIIRKVDTDLYNIFYSISSGSVAGETVSFYYKQWDANLNTISAGTLLYTSTIAQDAYHSTSNETYGGNDVIIDNMWYTYRIHFVCNNQASAIISILDPDWDLKTNNYIYLEVVAIDMDALSGSVISTFSHTFNTATQTLINGQQWTIRGIDSSPFAYNAGFYSGVFPNFITTFCEYSNPYGTGDYDLTNYVLYTRDGTTWHMDTVQHTTTNSDPTFRYFGGSSADSNGNANISQIQLTGEHFVHYSRQGTSGITYIFNGESVQIETWASVPLQLVKDNIYQLTGAFDTHYIAKLGSSWYFVNPQTFALETEMTFPAGYTIVKPFCTTDSISQHYYWHGRNSDEFPVILRGTNEAILEICKPYSSFTFNANRGFIAGNFFVDHHMHPSDPNGLRIFYLNNDTDVPDQVASFMVLQREGTNFHLIQEAGKPIRVDISNNSPVLTVQDYESTFRSNYIYNNEQLIITASRHNFGTTTSGVRDYRYTLQEIPSGVTVSSGILASGTMGDPAAGKLILYAMGSGINFAYTDDLFSGFAQIYPLPSGEAERIETSNYVGSGQYIFVTTSGDSPQFYQKEPMNTIFDPYPGLPNFRATIIRLDDRF